MKEFVEKLISRLEEELGNSNFEKATKEVNVSFYEGLAYAYGYSIGTAIQLAEEYKDKGKMVVNEEIKNPFANVSTAGCVNCDHKDEYIIELEQKYKNGWIPTTERLPEKNAIVLTCDKDGWISVKVNMPYAGVKNDFESGYYTAWMPLPEPFTPKEGRE